MTSPKSDRVLGIDFGERRIGLALSDPLGLTAQPLVTLPNRWEKTYADIGRVVTEHGVTRLVVGLPKHMSGQEGEKAEQARVFGEALAAHTGLPVEWMDERLTTAQVNRVLTASEMSGAKKRAVVDKLAATLILQSWLDRRHHREK